jgi:hypothetical protein
MSPLNNKKIGHNALGVVLNTIYLLNSFKSFHMFP